MKKFTLKESKGIILPVLILMMKVNRPVNVTYLMDEIGSSDKTVNKALRFLEKKDAVMRVGKFWQFCGDEYQLPLYWDERLEAGSGHQAQLELPGLNIQPGNFTGRIAEVGKNPEIKRSSNDLYQNHENRIRALEEEMRVLKSGKIPNTGKIPNNSQTIISGKFSEKTSVISGRNLPNHSENSSEIGEIPDETEEFSDLLKTTTTTNTDKSNIEILPVLENDPEKNPDDEYIRIAGRIKDLNDYYCQSEYGLPKFPNYAPIDDEIMNDIAKLHPDNRVLDFILPRAYSVSELCRWCRMSFNEAKEKLLKIYGIYGKYQKMIMDNPDISLDEMDYHYQKWKAEVKDHPEYGVQIVGHRIANRFDLESGRTADPLDFCWIGRPKDEAA